MNDIILKYLIKYYEENHTINDIKRDSVVEFEGQILKVGEFLASIRKQYRLYLTGDKSRGSMSSTAKNRYAILNSLEFEWEPRQAKAKYLAENDICLLFIEKYYETHKTLENIPDSFTFNGKEYSIKNFFSHIRTNHANYLANKNQKGSNSQTALRRYEILDKMNFDWTPLETKHQAYEEDDKYIRYIKEYYEKHKTLKDIPSKVIFEETELNIESFLTDRRKKHREFLSNNGYIPSELELKRWRELDAIKIDWEPKKTASEERMTNDKYIRYLQIHFQKNHTINDIKSKDTVEFEGETLKIGIFLSDIRKKYLKYTSGTITTTGIATELMLKRYKELEELEIDWQPSESTPSLAKIARANGLKTNRLKRYIEKFNGDIDKAIRICKQSAKLSKKARQDAKGITPTMSTIAKEFDINTDTLTTLLNRQALRTNKSKRPLMYDDSTNLRQYCINNGLNYTVIQKAVKLRMTGLCDEDLQSLINRCICEYKENGQTRPSTWIYAKYGNEILVSHLLTYLNLDSEAILYDMSKNCIDIYQAMENNSFQRSSKNQYDYLEFIYRNIIINYKNISSTEYDKEIISEALEEQLENYVNEYRLTEDEKEVLTSSINRYTNAVEEYHLFNVGFETDDKKRLQLILDYHLDEDEIEEAFFMPLKFDQKALVGRQSELYKRRIILKNLTVSWSYLSDKEKTDKKLNYNLSDEEITYIETTRQEIDKVKEKIFSK